MTFPRARGVLPVRVFLCAVLALQTTPYGAITPLLPGIVRDLGLADSRVGLITGAFTAGLLPACLALMLIRRPISDILVVFVGLGFLAVGCLTFAQASSLPILLAGRLAMGFGSGLCFAGASRWLVKSAPGQEGLFFGLSWGMLSVGTAVGPAAGAAAIALGSPFVHNVLTATFAACLAVLALIAMSPQMRQMARTRTVGPHIAVATLLRKRTFLIALTPLIVPALAIGLLFTLVPLLLAADGQEQWIAAIFIAAAVIGAGAGPVAGVVVRGVGERTTIVVTMAATTVLFASLAWPIGPLHLAIATIVILGIINQLLAVAAGETTRRTGTELGAPDTSSIFVPLMFALFETAGAVFSTRAAAVHAALPFIAVAAVAVATGALTARAMPRKRERDDRDSVVVQPF
ncbi:MFS transporter [Rhodococcus jostii]|uniref:MFS transporter n=1 Tax=Rhodococcus jostii TaxID=132919 RepID=UPI00294ACB3B|nr:MFS transporter [Rhodococcus jostii]